MFDTNNPVIQLCIQGTQAEYAKNPEQAAVYYREAWKLAQTDYEFCIAAHYLARTMSDVHDALYWNQKALQHATKVEDSRLVESFLPSLYLSLGAALDALGEIDEALSYYQLASQAGLDHDPKPPFNTNHTAR